MGEERQILRTGVFEGTDPGDRQLWITAYLGADRRRELTEAEQSAQPPASAFNLSTTSWVISIRSPIMTTTPGTLLRIRS